MATFNPDVQDTAPSNYLGLSQPISPLKNYSTPSGPDVNMSDTSAGTALQGLGSLFEGVVKAGDGLVKNIIQEELYAKIDEKREGLTHDLERAANIPQVQQVSDLSGNSPTAAPRNLLPDRPDGPLPPELARLPDTLGNLQSASGKLSPTYYTGRLDLIAKDMRTRFPGYRDYIDKQVESITGISPANDYVKQLMAQINASATSSKSEQEKLIAYVAKNDQLPGSQVMMQRVLQGKAGWVDVVGWSGREQEPMEKFKKDKAAFEAEKDNRELKGFRAEDAINSYADKKFANFWTTTTGGVGLSPQQITENAQKVQRGEEVPGMGENPNETAILWSQALSSAKSAARQDLLKKAHEGGANSIAAHLGPEKLDKLINSKLAPYDDTQALLTGKAITMAAATAEMSTAMTDSAQRRLFADPELGGAAKTYTVLNRTLGPNASQLIIEKAFAAGLDRKLQRRLDYETSMISNPDLTYTIKKAIENSANVGIGMPDPLDPARPVPQDHKSYFNELFAKSRFIGDKNIPVVNQQQFVKAFYGPGNEGLISKFAKDARDPVSGAYLEGNIDVFRRLYGNQSVIKGVKKLGESDGQSWDMFKTSADKAFVNEVFAPELKDLVQLPDNKGPGFKIIFREAVGNSRPYFEVIPGKRNNDSGQDLYIRSVQDSITRLNKGFDTMTAIVREDGRDPNAYVLGTMVSLGLDPNKVEGIPADLMKAVINSRPKDPFDTKNSKKTQGRVGE